MPQPTFILDFDSTLVQCESLDELARLCLAGEEHRAAMEALEQLTRRGMTGELAFDESLKARLELFTATRQQIEVLVTSLMAYISPSARAERDWFNAHKEHIYVISGGFEEYIIPVIERLGMLPEHVYANRFTYQGNTIRGFDASRLTSRAGGKAAQAAALELPHPLIAIGDGYTDYEIKAKGLADEFWAYAETVQRLPVTEKADRIIRSFTEITLPDAINV